MRMKSALTLPSLMLGLFFGSVLGGSGTALASDSAQGDPALIAWWTFEEEDGTALPLPVTLLATLTR